MIDQGTLISYSQHDHFIFTPESSLRVVCNAPTDKSGVYLVYSLLVDRKELIYIGSSGAKLSDGSIRIRKAGLGGIKDRIVNGVQFGERRTLSWPKKMLCNNIPAIEVWWYITHGPSTYGLESPHDCPIEVERRLIDDFVRYVGRFPLWNRKRC
jgi:hypothetical protein